MEYQNIKINDLEFAISSGHPTLVKGRRYRKPMAGIDLKFSVWGADKKKCIEDLFASKGITVEDPFAKRTYKAKCRIISSSYEKGSSLHHYHHYQVKVMELEISPKVKELAIQGQNFKVVRYKERRLDKRSGFSITALLQLTDEEFTQLKASQTFNSVNVQRMGTDKNPVALAWGHGLHWANHEGKSGRHIYQVVKFYPPDMVPSRLSLHDLTIQNAVLNREVLAAQVRLESLLNQLVLNKVIDQSFASKIMEDKPENLLDSLRYNQMLAEMDRVSSAKTLLEADQ